MRVIEQYCEWVQEPPVNTLQLIEVIGRTCYKSEYLMTKNTAKDFVQKILKSGHHSVIEHVSASMRFITDRGVTHEMVRHRIASYSQESTRYCNYGRVDPRSGKEFPEITIIQPVFFGKMNINAQMLWAKAMEECEQCYLQMLQNGCSPQEARAVLPNSLKTEIVMTANLREWRHFFTLRCAKVAHPQMRDLAIQALIMFREKVPVMFDDIWEKVSQQE